MALEFRARRTASAQAASVPKLYEAAINKLTNSALDLPGVSC